jgi:hypothetical protein
MSRPLIPEHGDAVVMPDGTTNWHVTGRVAGSGPDGWLVFLDDPKSTMVEVNEEPDQHLPERLWSAIRVYF